MICKYCNKDREEDDFQIAAKIKGKFYRRKKCRFCKQNTQNERRRRIRAWLIDYKEKLTCSRCGFFDFRALEFHHHNNNKNMNIADAVRRGWSIERIKSEIAKCEIICSNCHRIEHYKGLA